MRDHPDACKRLLVILLHIQIEKIETAKNFLKMNLISDMQIAQGTGVTLEQVQKLKKNYNKILSPSLKYNYIKDCQYPLDYVHKKLGTGCKTICYFFDGRVPVFN